MTNEESALFVTNHIRGLTTIHEEISYIMECILCEYRGNAKTLIVDLTNKIKNTKGFSAEYSLKICGELDLLFDQLARVNQDFRPANDTVIRLRRMVWNTINELEGHTRKYASCGVLSEQG